MRFGPPGFEEAAAEDDLHKGKARELVASRWRWKRAALWPIRLHSLSATFGRVARASVRVRCGGAH